MDWIRGWVVEAGYSAALGVHCDDISETSVALSLPYADENSNPGKALHGGCAASLGVIASQAVTRAALGADAAPFHTANNPRPAGFNRVRIAARWRAISRIEGIQLRT